ncbi:MAG TPA: sialidase family protein [Gaiellaceae bacterium]|nr:sialidase family protein [Gaiellaceae bacterium]
MRRLLIGLVLAFAAPAAAATIHAPKQGGTILGTAAPDHLVGGPGNDFVQAAWGGVDRVDCGGGFNVVSADLGDKVAANCQVVSRRLSVDTSTNPAGQHETAVEPADFAWGTTVVAAYQVGRFASGGASNIGFAVSNDSGETWTRGLLPGVTVESTPAGPGSAASDPSVAYDAAHAVWLISTLTIEQGGTRITVAHSSDGLHWSAPVTAATGPALDKEWVACDNGVSSPFRGRCYALYTDDDKNITVSQSSDDGGVTWSTPVRATGVLVGTQPAVLPDGTLVTIAGNYTSEQALTGTIESFRSTDGGATFTRTTLATLSSSNNDPMRAISLPSLAIDAAGTLFASWADCRFRVSCTANDIVISSSTDGVTWSAPSRVPLASTSSTLDAMIPGLGADPSRPGHLGLVYAYYTPGSCAKGACALGVAFVQSPDGGASWTKPLRLDTEAMQMSWLAEAEGRMVGDYLATAFAGDRAVPVYTLAIAPTGRRLHEAIFAASLQSIG